jgi:hypothetical protein
LELVKPRLVITDRYAPCWCGEPVHRVLDTATWRVRLRCWGGHEAVDARLPSAAAYEKALDQARGG